MSELQRTRAPPPDCGEGLALEDPTDPAAIETHQAAHDERRNNCNYLQAFLLAAWCCFWCPKALKSETEPNFNQIFVDAVQWVVEAQDQSDAGSESGPNSTGQPSFGGTTATNPSGGAQQPNLPKGNGDERDPERGGKKSQRNKASAVSGRQPSRQFACPYLFGGSLRHHCCRGFNRIGDVRQHLFRCHRQPAHYCPTCGRVFDDEQSSGAHIRQQNCSPAAFNFPGMTSDQWIDISTRAQAPPHTVPGGDAARWYIIWDILFPGAQRPPTPYINGSIFTVRLRDFAQRFLDNDGAWGLVYDLIPWWLPNVHPDYRQELHDAFEALIGRLVASAEAEDRPDNVD